MTQPHDMSPEETPASLGELIAEADRLDHALADQASPVSMLFLRNLTIEGIEPYLRHRLLASGVRPHLQFGGYGSIRQDLAAAGPVTLESTHRIAVVCLMLEELDPTYALPGWTGHRAMAELQALFEAMAASALATIVVHTFVAPFWPESGSQPSGTRSQAIDEVAALNQYVRDFVRSHGPRFCLADWNLLAHRLGESSTMDYRYWYLAKAPFKAAFLDAFAHELEKIVLALKGHTKKCLVLDCDNTLWGGVVGEDGIDGLQLDGHDYPGKVYYDFQKTVLHLADRGVLIALCSKNNEPDVLQVLDTHPWCLLKRSHLAGYRINWDDKASNIASLAREFNLGLDSFVFIDDSLTEIELVRQVLPEVTSLPVPQRLYTYPELLLRDGWFDTLSVGTEDRQRVSLYQQESRRAAERDRHVDLASYLTSLDIHAEIHPARSGEVDRVAQLTQKTNQFNLTTRRYTAYDIERMRSADDSAIFALSARDRFGALGLVGVVILLRIEPGRARVDTLLMSCRALARGLETAFVIECMRQIRTRWAIDSWEAEFIPSRKNAQVAGFWDGLGFSPVSPGTPGTRRFRLNAPEVTIAIPGHLTIHTD